MADENELFLLAVKNLIMAYPGSSSSGSHTPEEQEHQGHQHEYRENSNPSDESTQGVEVPGGSAHQEVCERKKKEKAEKEKQIMLCKRIVKRNFVWRHCCKRNVKKLFSGRQCRPG